MPLISNLLPPFAPPLRSRRRRLVFGSPGTRLALILGAAAIVLLCLGARVSDVVLHNHSPSMPVGFYLRTSDPVAHGTIVTVRAADAAEDYSKLRAFAGERDRFIKRVAGIAGDIACGDGNVVTLNGAVVARRAERDSAGRALPMWNGCRRLAEDEVLLLGESEDSFDGRYFGVVHRSLVEGVWRPLWVKSAARD